MQEKWSRNNHSTEITKIYDVRIMEIIETLNKLEYKEEKRFEFIENQIFPRESSIPIPRDAQSEIMNHQFDLCFQINYQTDSEPVYIFRKLNQSIRRQLTEKQNFFYLKNTRVLDMVGNVFQPDVVITASKLEKKSNRVTPRPFTIIEVVSASTLEKDQNLKTKLYQQIDSLKEYILIFSTEKTINYFFRNQSEWELKNYDLSDFRIELKSGVFLTKEIFEKPKIANLHEEPQSRQSYQIPHKEYNKLLVLYNQIRNIYYENTAKFWQNDYEITDKVTDFAGIIITNTKNKNDALVSMSLQVTLSRKLLFEQNYENYYEFLVRYMEKELDLIQPYSFFQELKNKF